MMKNVFPLAGLFVALSTVSLWAGEPRVKVYGSLALNDITRNAFDPSGLNYEALRRRQVGTPYYLTSSAEKENSGSQFGLGAQLRISGPYWLDLHWQNAKMTEVSVDTHIDSLLREEEICPFVPPCITLSTWSSEDQTNRHHITSSALSLGIKKDLFSTRENIFLAPGLGWHTTQVKDQITVDYMRVLNTIPTPGIRRTEKTLLVPQSNQGRLRAPYVSLDAELWPAGKDGIVGIGMSAKWFILGARTHTVADRSLIDDFSIPTQRPRWQFSLHASLAL